MAEGKYYAKSSYGRTPQWELWKRSRGGDRRLAKGMSEKTARRTAKLMNEDEAVFDQHIAKQMDEYREVAHPQPLMVVLKDWSD